MFFLTSRGIGPRYGRARIQEALRGLSLQDFRAAYPATKEKPTAETDKKKGVKKDEKSKEKPEAAAGKTKGVKKDEQMKEKPKAAADTASAK